jgi:hypothetical protein
MGRALCDGYLLGAFSDTFAGADEPRRTLCLATASRVMRPFQQSTAGISRSGEQNIQVVYLNNKPIQAIHEMRNFFHRPCCLNLVGGPVPSLGTRFSLQPSIVESTLTQEDSDSSILDRFPQKRP